MISGADNWLLKGNYGDRLNSLHDREADFPEKSAGGVVSELEPLYGVDAWVEDY